MSLEEFLHMGGYAKYVWSAYGITFIVLVGNILIPIFQRKRVLRQNALQRKRQQP